MFNLFQYEKRLKEEEDRKREEKKLEEDKRIRKNRNILMAKEYKDRVMNFLNDMTIPGCEIKLKEETKITNPREEMLKGKPEKNFVNKGNKRERKRIDGTIQNNKPLHYFLIPHPKHSYSRNISVNLPMNRIKDFKFNKDISFLQSEMRFKPRTDFERVVESVSNSYLITEKGKKSLLQRHLSKIGLNKLQINKKNFAKNHHSFKDKEIMSYSQLPKNPPINSYNKNHLNYSYNSSLKKIPLRERKITLNSEAKHLLNYLHVKTHFKAVEEIAENKCKYLYIYYYILVDTKLSDCPKGKVNNNNDRYYISFDNSNDKTNVYMISNYNKSLNPYTKIKKNDENREESLKILANMILSFEPKEDIVKKKKEKEIFDIKNHKMFDDTITIDNEVFSKDSEMDLIAKKVLKKCNVYHSKRIPSNTRKSNGM